MPALFCMGLLSQIKADAKIILGNQNDFAIPVRFIHGAQDVTVNAIHTRHNLGIDTEGNRVNTPNAHVTVSEELLVNAGYTVRINDEVRMVGHVVYATDSAGIERKYLIAQTFPDETIGTITCMLEDAE